MKNYISKFKNWVEQNRVEFALLLFIIILASFFRLWRIDEYLPFLGDEGRDVRVVSRFLEHFDLMFVGPRTSIGNMYLGPLYYYMMAPFLLLFNFFPTGPAVGVALLGVATVFLVWFTAREWFGKAAAFWAAALYAISPTVINLSKHSWNPNIMPFFSLIVIYSIWRVWRRRGYKWLMVLGISYAFVIQSHYLGLLLLPTIGVVWLLSLVACRPPARLDSAKRAGEAGLSPNALRRFTLFSVYGLLLFAVLMSPLALFDAKHGWRNFDAIKTFFSQRQTTVSARPWNAAPSVFPLLSKEITPTLVSAKNESLGRVVTAVLVVSTLTILVVSVRKLKNKSILPNNPDLPYFLIILWVLFGLIGLGNYKQSIFSHYYGFMFTALFLLLGGIVQKLYDKKYGWIVTLPLILLAALNLLENPLKYPPQRQMQRVQKIDKKIIEESGGQPFNLALIAKRNYEEGYLYFLEREKAQVREIDALKPDETITSQLFVVCEDPVCEPINHPKAEIANFGWVKVDSEWEVDGVHLFKLIHTEK